MKPGIQDVLAHWIPGFIAFAWLGFIAFANEAGPFARLGGAFARGRPARC